MGLKLELTESLVLEDMTIAIDKMHALRKVGVRFSMDDFGTGYSSPKGLKLKRSSSYLSKVVVRAIKVTSLPSQNPLNVYVCEGLMVRERLSQV